MKNFFVAFINFRMIGIHCGIQGGHCAGELQTDLNQARYNEAQKKLAHDWLNNDKIFIFQHAGQSADLIAAYNKFTELQDKYPTVLFREEAGAFNDSNEGLGAVTAWGIVIPESVFMARSVWDSAVDIPEQREYFRTTDGVEISPGVVQYFDWRLYSIEYELLKYKSGTSRAY